MAENKNYAILRTGKIKSYDHLTKVGAHNYRLIPAGTVPGAKPPEELVPGGKDLVERVRKKFEELKLKHKKGMVIAVEILMTLSPEWWAAADNWQKKEFFEQSVKSLHDKFGKGVVSIIVHTDESTPHIQAVVVPIYYAIEKKTNKPTTPEGIAKRAREEAAAPRVWRLSYHEVLGGNRRVLAEYQTKYHSYVAHLGLERGEDTVGKGIEHTTLKEYAKRLKAEEERLAGLERQLLGKLDEVGDRSARLERMTERFKNELQTFRQNQVQANAKKRRLEKRAKYLHKKAESLGEREIALDVRDVLSQERFAEAEEKERQVEAREAQVASLLQDIEQREAQLARSNSELEGRDVRLSDKEEAIAEREEAVSVQETQIAIIADIASGQYEAVWPFGNQRPSIDREEVDEKTQKAVDAPWSEKLIKAGIAIARTLGQRSRLSDMIARLRSKARTARKKEKQLAERDTTLAQSERNAAAIRRLADSRLAAANDKMAEAGRSTAESERLRASADAASMEADQRRATVEQKILGLEKNVADMRNTVASLQKTEKELVLKKSKITESLAGLHQEKASLTAEIEPMRKDRQELDKAKGYIAKQQQQIASDRENLEREKATNAFGSELLEGMLEDRHSIIAGRDAFVVTPHDKSQKPQMVEQAEVPAWFRPLVLTAKRFHDSIDRAEESEKAFRIAREATLRRYPEKAAEIDEMIASPPPTTRIYDYSPSDHTGAGR